MGLFALLWFELPLVELKLFAFKDVTIATSALARSGGDAGWKEEMDTITYLYISFKSMNPEEWL